MAGVKKTSAGWVAYDLIRGYDDEMRTVKSPVFRTMKEAERYGILEMGIRQCDFCEHIATNHFNAFGNKLSGSWGRDLYGDYYTCDNCIPKVKQDIDWKDEQREERLKKKYGRDIYGKQRRVKKTEPCPRCKSTKTEPSWAHGGYIQCNACGVEWIPKTKRKTTKKPKPSPKKKKVPVVAKKRSSTTRKRRLSSHLQKLSNYPPFTMDGKKWYVLDEHRDKSDAIENRDSWKQFIRENDYEYNSIRVEKFKDYNGMPYYAVIVR